MRFSRNQAHLPSSLLSSTSCVARASQKAKHHTKLQTEENIKNYCWFETPRLLPDGSHPFRLLVLTLILICKPKKIWRIIIGLSLRVLYLMGPTSFRLLVLILIPNCKPKKSIWNYCWFILCAFVWFDRWKGGAFKFLFRLSFVF